MIASQSKKIGEINRKIIAALALSVSGVSSFDVFSSDGTEILSGNFASLVEDKNLSRCLKETTNATDASQVVSISCPSYFILSAKGVEHFPNLKKLNLSGNRIEYIDLSKNKKIKDLNLEGNYLREVDVSQQKQLESLSVGVNPLLKSLDISENKQLVNFRNQYNKFEVDISNNTQITDLNLSFTGLKYIDLTVHFKLASLYLAGNSLMQLGLYNNPSLRFLNVDNNALLGLDVSNNVELESLSAFNNRISDVNLLANRNLKHINLSSNQLKSIDTTVHTNLHTLHANSNQLTSIDLSNNAQLSGLYLSENSMISVPFGIENIRDRFAIIRLHNNLFSLQEKRKLQTLGKEYHLLMY